MRSYPQGGESRLTGRPTRRQFFVVAGAVGATASLAAVPDPAFGGTQRAEGAQSPSARGADAQRALNAATSALLLIDLQPGIFSSKLQPIGPAALVATASALGSAMRARGAVVMYSRTLNEELLNLPNDGPRQSARKQPADADGLISGLNVHPRDVVVTKRQWGAFYGTDLEEQLRRRSIKTIVLGGVATNFGVESTARDAYDRGYELVFVRDAMASSSAELNAFCLQQTFPLMGHVWTAAQVIAALQARA